MGIVLSLVFPVMLLLHCQLFMPYSSQTEWNLVFALIRSTMPHPEAARLSFDLVSSLISDGPDQSITTDNFAGLVTLLDDFATAAGVIVESLRQKGRRVEVPTSSKYVNNE